jgi:Cys-tRNA(Pro) deacylase
MRPQDIPVTSAIRALRVAQVTFAPHFYAYINHGGTRHAAECLGVDHHAVVKTLVMEAHTGAPRRQPFLVLMHGDFEVSTKQLARLLEAKAVLPVSEPAVERLTGYLPGGVSPFGPRSSLPIYVEETILAMDRIFINGGKRGFLLELHPFVLTAILKAVPVRVGIPESRA